MTLAAVKASLQDMDLYERGLVAKGRTRLAAARGAPAGVRIPT
jgi:hypothetical protein